MILVQTEIYLYSSIRFNILVKEKTEESCQVVWLSGSP